METETKLTQFIQKETIIATIQTQQEVDLCLIQNKRAKAMVDWAEQMRVEATKPILESKRKIDLLWKNRIAPLEALILHNKTELEKYLFAEEEKKSKELKEETGFSNKEANSLAKIEVKQEAGVSYRTDFDIEVLDLDKVPAKYIIKSVNEKLVKDSMKENNRNIPGLKITPRKILVTR